MANILRAHVESAGMLISASVAAVRAAVPSSALPRFFGATEDEQAQPDRHTIWFLDSLGWTDDETSGTWRADLTTAFFSAGTASWVGVAAAELVGQVGPSMLAYGGAVEAGRVETDRATLARRLRPFLQSVPERVWVTAEIKSGETADLAVPASRSIVLGPSDGNGLSHNTVSVPAGRAGQTATVRASDSDLVAQPGLVRLVGPEGWGVVADLDSLVWSGKARSSVRAARAVLMDRFVPDGPMAAMVRTVAGLLDEPAVWYLSDWTYNLYPCLRTFRDAHQLPFGPVLLQQWSWMNLSGMVGALMSAATADPGRFAARVGATATLQFDPVVAASRQHRIDALDKMYGRFPRRRMICIGDAKGSDPEVFGHVMRLRPGWIRKVFIRCRSTGLKLSTGPDRSDGQKGGCKTGEAGDSARPGRRRPGRPPIRTEAGDRGGSGPDGTIEKIRASRRFGRAFRDVPSELWELFDDPAAVVVAVQEMIERE